VKQTEPRRPVNADEKFLKRVKITLPLRLDSMSASRNTAAN
jgi:hypothetical protein